MEKVWGGRRRSVIVFELSTALTNPAQVGGLLAILSILMLVEMGNNQNFDRLPGKVHVLFTAIAEVWLAASLRSLKSHVLTVCHEKGWRAEGMQA